MATYGFKFDVSDRYDCSLSYDKDTRTLSIIPDFDTFQVVINGMDVKLPELSIEHQDQFGTYYFFIDSDRELKVSRDEWNIFSSAPVAKVYQDSSGNRICEDYRYHYNRDLFWHRQEGEDRGVHWLSGFDISGYTEGLDSSDAFKFEIDSGVIRDRSLNFETEVFKTGRYSLIYHGTNRWEFERYLEFPFSYSSGLQYQENKTKTSVPNGKYVNYWVFGVKSSDERDQIILALGQRTHVYVQDALLETFNSCDWSDFPLDAVPLYRITYLVNSSYTNSYDLVISKITDIRGEKFQVSGDSEASLSITTGFQALKEIAQFNIGTQESEAHCIQFKPDGTKMYILGNSGNDVTSYSLSTPWNILSASYDSGTEFSVTAQDGSPTGLFFKPDGMAFYVCGVDNDKVYRYNMSSAWNLSTASFANDFSVAAKDNSPYAIFFSPDGLNMYMYGTQTDSVHRYTMSVAWDITTCVFHSTLSLTTFEQTPGGIYLTPDGKTLYVVGITYAKIQKIKLNTAWDLNTAVLSNDIVSIGITKPIASSNAGRSSMTFPSGIFVNEDQNKIWICEYFNDVVLEYDLIGAAKTVQSDNRVILDSPLIDVKGGLYVSGSIRCGFDSFYHYAPQTVTTFLQHQCDSYIGRSSSNSGVLYTTMTTGSLTIATALTSGALTVGGTSQTGALTLGQSTASNTLNLHTGVTSTGNTKTLNLGTGGASGSTTNINIGSSTAGATSTNNVYGITKHYNDFVMPKTSGFGIKVDTTTPTYGWRDLEGLIYPKTTGVGAPTLTTYRGNVRDFAFSVNDDMDLKFHIPHDYVPGSDMFIHVHWSHNGTNISGSLVINWYVTYAKGHNQASNGDFFAEITPVQTLSGLNITNTPQYRHRIDEFQLTAATPSATQIDSDIIEVDGLILIHFDVPTIPTITGGAGKPFIHFVDIHYQSTNLPTKNKAPNFWA